MVQRQTFGAAGKLHHKRHIYMTSYTSQALILLYSDTFMFTSLVLILLQVQTGYEHNTSIFCYLWTKAVNKIENDNASYRSSSGVQGRNQVEDLGYIVIVERISNRLYTQHLSTSTNPNHLLPLHSNYQYCFDVVFLYFDRYRSIFYEISLYQSISIHPPLQPDRMV